MPKPDPGVRGPRPHDHPLLCCLAVAFSVAACSDPPPVSTDAAVAPPITKVVPQVHVAIPQDEILATQRALATADAGARVELSIKLARQLTTLEALDPGTDFESSKAAWALALEAAEAAAQTDGAALALQASVRLSLKLHDLNAATEQLGRLDALKPADPAALAEAAVLGALLAGQLGESDATARLATAADLARPVAPALAAEALAARGSLLLELGQYSESAAAWAQAAAVATRPELQARAWTGEGWALLMGMAAGAVPHDATQPMAAFKKARAAIPKHAPQQADISARMAWLALMAGLPETAEQLVDEARMLDAIDAYQVRDLAALAYAESLLAREENRKASLAFDMLAQRLLGPKRAPAPGLLWRARHGRSQALRALGSRRKAAKISLKAISALMQARDQPNPAPATVDGSDVFGGAIAGYLGRKKTSAALAVANTGLRRRADLAERSARARPAIDADRIQTLSDYQAMLRRYVADRHTADGYEGEDWKGWRTPRRAMRAELNDGLDGLIGPALDHEKLDRRRLQKKLGRQRAFMLVFADSEHRWVFWVDAKGIDHRALEPDEDPLQPFLDRAERVTQLVFAPADLVLTAPPGLTLRPVQSASEFMN